MKVAVIGSGVAGLTAGATLAQAGHEVTVLEQYHSILGGMGTLTGALVAKIESTAAGSSPGVS